MPDEALQARGRRLRTRALAGERRCPADESSLRPSGRGGAIPQCAIVALVAVVASPGLAHTESCVNVPVEVGHRVVVQVFDAIGGFVPNVWFWLRRPGQPRQESIATGRSGGEDGFFQLPRLVVGRLELTLEWEEVRRVVLLDVAPTRVGDPVLVATTSFFESTCTSPCVVYAQETALQLDLSREDLGWPSERMNECVPPRRRLSTAIGTALGHRQPAVLSDCAGVVAEPWCSADRDKVRHRLPNRQAARGVVR
jgi:hypothetical protein